MKKEHWLIVVSVISLLLPVYVGALSCLAVCVILVWRGRYCLKERIVAIGWWSGWWIFVGIVSIVYENISSQLVCVALLVVGLLLSYYAKMMTYSLYQMILNVILLGSIVVNLKACYDYWNYVNIEQLPLTYILLDATPTFRAESTFFNPNYLGLFCVFVILIAYYAFVSRPQWKWRTIAIVASLLALCAMVLTASRMIYPALLASLVVAIIFMQPRLSKWLIGICCVGSVVFVAYPTLLPRLASVLLGVQQRFDIWETSWQIFLRSPLYGRGAFAYFKYYYLFEGPALPHAHNLLLDALNNYGLIGISLLWVASIDSIRLIVLSIKQRKCPHELGLILSLSVAIFVHGIVDVAIFWLQTGLLASFIVVGGVQLLKQKM